LKLKNRAGIGINTYEEMGAGGIASLPEMA